MEVIDKKLIGELLSKTGASARLGGGICLIRILGRMRILWGWRLCAPDRQWGMEFAEAFEVVLREY